MYKNDFEKIPWIGNYLLAPMHQQRPNGLLR